MPLGIFNDHDNRGTESNGARSVEYCHYCYSDGSFTNPSLTLGEMLSISKHHMMKELGFTDEKANFLALSTIPKLKRWVVCGIGDGE